MATAWIFIGCLAQDSPPPILTEQLQTKLKVYPFSFSKSYAEGRRIKVSHTWFHHFKSLFSCASVRVPWFLSIPLHEPRTNTSVDTCVVYRQNNKHNGPKSVFICPGAACFGRPTWLASLMFTAIISLIVCIRKSKSRMDRQFRCDARCHPSWHFISSHEAEEDVEKEHIVCSIRTAQKCFTLNLSELLDFTSEYQFQDFS